ncbi:hypothetical protein WA158_004689 [Blastocystis sp. Blastoise]
MSSDGDQTVKDSRYVSQGNYTPRIVSYPVNIIKSTCVKKCWQELSNLHVCQTLKMHTGSIWCMKFSPDHQYLAAAGDEGIIYIWKVHKCDASQWELYPDQRVFDDEPYKIFTGHKSHVVDLSWSSSLFLLSASLDMTVRLWHISKPECLCIFQHSDMVTSVDFHPNEDSYFLTGCMDSKLRIWNIVEGKVVRWIQTPAIITAASFIPGGRLCSAGLVDGTVIFYYTDGLRYFTQIECRNHHGKDRNGRKVCGLSFMNSPAGNRVLVSTNDSRLRLIGMENFSVLHKYKGLTNRNAQLKATFSSDFEHIISPSDDGYFIYYIWRTADDLYKKSMMGNYADKSDSYEYFKATVENESLTTAIFASNKVIEMCRPGQYNIAAKAAREAIANNNSTQTPHSGFMIVTGSTNGTIQVFASFGEPKKI